MTTKKHFFLALVIFLIVFGYAVLRYNIIKGVPWVELPFFISNKAFALSSVIFIGISYGLGSLAHFLPKVFVRMLGFRKFFGLLGFGLLSLHGFLSLLMLTPTRYPKFFLNNGGFNLIGELSVLFGALAFFVFAFVAIVSIPSIAKSIGEERWQSVQHLGYVALILVFIHVFTMGIEGWLKPSSWPGGLLPISLIAGVVVVFVLLLKVAAIILPEERKL